MNQINGPEHSGPILGPSGRGGTGRHTGLKILRRQRREGSNPSVRTNKVNGITEIASSARGSKWLRGSTGVADSAMSRRRLISPLIDVAMYSSKRSRMIMEAGSMSCLRCSSLAVTGDIPAMLCPRESSSRANLRPNSLVKGVESAWAHVHARMQTKEPMRREPPSELCIPQTCHVRPATHCSRRGPRRSRLRCAGDSGTQMWEVAAASLRRFLHGTSEDRAAHRPGIVRIQAQAWISRG